MAKSIKKFSILTLLCCLIFSVSLFVGFNHQTARADEVTVKNVSDLTGKTYSIVSGNACLGNVGRMDYFSVKMRLYLTEGYDVKFFLSSDGEMPCNTGAFGGWYSFRITGGTVYGGYPGGWHFFSSGNATSEALTAGSVISVEFGTDSYASNGVPTWFFKVNGTEILRLTDKAYGDGFLGVEGTMLAVSTATPVLIESATATCNHEFAWTEPDANNYTEYACTHCNVVMDSGYVVTEKNVSDLMGVTYRVVFGNANLGNVGRMNYYSVSMRLYLTEGYDVKFFLSSDGETPCNTGAFGGWYSFRIMGGTVYGGYPGGWHFYSSGNATSEALTAGATVSVEFGTDSYASNGIPTWFFKVNGTEILRLTDKAYGDGFLGVEGTMLAVSSATPVLIESATATCNHNFVEKNEFVGCEHITVGCSECGMVWTSAIEHDFVDHEAVAPTCEGTGTIFYRECSRCSVKVNADGEVVETVTVEAIGHDYQWVAPTAPTCTENGVGGHYSCTRCEKIFDENYAEIASPESIEKSGHSMIHYEAIAPTCSETGTVEFWQCERCHKFFADAEGDTEITEVDVPTSDHTYGEWIEKVEATTKETGTLGHYHCSVCGKDFDENHDELDSLVIPRIIETDQSETDKENAKGCLGSVSALSMGSVMLCLAAALAFRKKRN